MYYSDQSTATKEDSSIYRLDNKVIQAAAKQVKDDQCTNIQYQIDNVTGFQRAHLAPPFFRFLTQKDKIKSTKTIKPKTTA
jgi:hypothetical protein